MAKQIVLKAAKVKMRTKSADKYTNEATVKR